MVAIVIDIPAFVSLPSNLSSARINGDNGAHFKTSAPSKRPLLARQRRCSPHAQLSNYSQQSSSKVQGEPKWGELRSGEFDKLIAERRLPLCFIGMSNCGKSHWSNALVAERDFQHVCVDDEIERALEPELTGLGYAGIADMAKWMGYPADERFSRNEARYLDLEENVTRNITKAGNGNGDSSNFVLDTTGSVVYLSDSTQEYLRNTFFIVHLAANEDVLEKMRESYFESPKPVVWGDSYNQQEDETSDQALRRCYEGLLRERLKRYNKLAHISIPAQFAFSMEATVDDLLQLVKSTLDQA